MPQLGVMGHTTSADTRIEVPQGSADGKEQLHEPKHESTETYCGARFLSAHHRQKMYLVHQVP
jgi:hypothetical protein